MEEKSIKEEKSLKEIVDEQIKKLDLIIKLETERRDNTNDNI